MLTYGDLSEFLKMHDRTSYYALNALRKMKNEKIVPYIDDILKIVNHRKIVAPWEMYLKRMQGLRILQTEFERIGIYQACSYHEIQPIDDE